MWLHSIHWASEDERWDYLFTCPIAMTSKLETLVWVSKTEMLVPPIRVMLCPLLPGAVREIRRETRRLPRLTVTQPFLVLSRNAPPHSEEERCVTRDDTENGCVKDYCHAGYGMCKFTCFSACLNARVLCLSFNMANLCRLQVTWAPHVHKGRSTVAAILKGLKKASFKVFEKY